MAIDSLIATHHSNAAMPNSKLHCDALLAFQGIFHEAAIVAI
jgi:hypothetical protein